MTIFTNVYTGASARIVKEARYMKIAAVAMISVRVASWARVIHMVAQGESRCIEQQLPTTRLEQAHICRS